MNSYDLNVSSENAVELALARGFAKAFVGKVFQIEKADAFKQLKGSEAQVKVAESTNSELLRQACKKQFQLICPLKVPQYFNDDGLIRALAKSNKDAGDLNEKEKAFEIPISALLQSSHVQRAKHLWQIRKFLEKCQKLKAPFVFTTRASNEFEAKSPREIIAIGQLLGLTYEKAQYSISKQCEKIIE